MGSYNGSPFADNDLSELWATSPARVVPYFAFLRPFIHAFNRLTMPFTNVFQALWRKIRPSRRENPRCPEPKALQSDYFDVSGYKVQRTDQREIWDVTKTSVPSLKDCPFEVRRYAKQTIQEKLQVAKFEMVGRGGFGEVLKARSTAKEDQDELYALKIVKPKTVKINGLKTLASTHELEILQELDHENIVRFYDHLSVGNHLTRDKNYLVLKMEFLERDLSNCVSEIGCTESPEILNRFFLQVGGAVAYMHSQRIVHHDIKPSNIMVKFSPDQSEKPLLEQMSSCHYKLIDFGLAIRYKGGVDDKVRDRQNRNGTRTYFCPKKANKKTAYNPYAADAYALGVSALYILQGATLLCKMRGLEPLSAQQICYTHIKENPDNVDLYKTVFALLEEEAIRSSIGKWLKELEDKLNGVL